MGHGVVLRDLMRMEREREGHRHLTRSLSRFLALNNTSFVFQSRKIELIAVREQGTNLFGIETRAKTELLLLARRTVFRIRVRDIDVQRTRRVQAQGALNSNANMIEL